MRLRVSPKQRGSTASRAPDACEPLLWISDLLGWSPNHRGHFLVVELLRTALQVQSQKLTHTHTHTPLTACLEDAKRLRGFSAYFADLELKHVKCLAMCLASSTGKMGTPIIKSDHKCLK